MAGCGAEHADDDVAFAACPVGVVTAIGQGVPAAFEIGTCHIVEDDAGERRGRRAALRALLDVRLLVYQPCLVGIQVVFEPCSSVRDELPQCQAPVAAGAQRGGDAFAFGQLLEQPDGADTARLGAAERAS